MKNFNSQNFGSILVSAFIFLFVIAYMLVGYFTLDEESRRVPILTGYLTIFLLTMDIFGRTWLKEEDHDMIGIPVGREISALLYVGALAIAIYVAGYFITLPLYLIASMVFQGRQTLKLAVVVALPTSIAIYVIFELLLEFELFRGILFS